MNNLYLTCKQLEITDLPRILSICDLLLKSPDEPSLSVHKWISSIQYTNDLEIYMLPRFGIIFKRTIKQD